MIAALSRQTQPQREGRRRYTLRVTHYDMMYTCILKRAVPHPRNEAQRLRSGLSEASAFRTSDCDSPNCRAIMDTLTPALNPARTALT